MFKKIQKKIITSIYSLTFPVPKNFSDSVQFQLLKGKELTIYEWYQLDIYNRWFGTKNPIESVSISEKDLFLVERNIKYIQVYFLPFSYLHFV